MTTPEVDRRSTRRQENDEQIAAEPRLAPIEPRPDAKPLPVEAYLRRCDGQPLAVAGVVDNGLVRPLDRSRADRRGTSAGLRVPALNDLAWLLAHHEPIDLERALALVDKAIEIEPRNVHFRDTRGHVLAKLNRWQDAVVELEQAVNGLPGNRGTHAVLAQTYDNLGNKELADAHRSLSQSSR
jgi:Flp pilus assembly protein TadD